jgi:MFS family permease
MPLANSNMVAESQTATPSDDSLGRVDDSLAAIEKVEAGTSPAAAPPPQSHNQNQLDGGLRAWLQVVGGWCIAFNTWGVLNTFGIFQTYYESGALFTETSSSIAWIGTIQALCIVSLGLVSGPLYDRGYLLALLLVGSFMIVFSFMMLSISTTFWEALLAQGFCFGTAAGLIWVPMLAVIPAYFRTKLGLAVGLAISGSSIGGVM